MRWMVVPLLVAVLAVGAGCGTGGGTAPGTAGTPQASGTRSGPAGTPGATGAPGAESPVPVVTVDGAGCRGSAVSQGDGFPEVRGTGEGVELWGLLFGEVPLRRGVEIKIVWRMTGEGPLRKVEATLPDGARARLAWGPEEHGGSNWRRPGQEWGTGFVFPERGCWKVELTRDRGKGHVWLRVR